MEYVFFISIGIALFLCITYLFIIGVTCVGWIKTKNTMIDFHSDVFISVIIAARNEEETIINCLTAILKQSYPNQKYEVIVVDDASTDATNKLVSEFCESNKFVRLITLTEEKNKTGKKVSITSAIKIARGELIVTTDADCIMGENWLSAIASFYLKTNAKMTVAPVSFHDEKNIFQKMQSLEFMALMSSGGGVLHYKKAIMCNGANLAYPKQLFNELGGFEGISNNASGDDVLLMYKINSQYPGSIQFLKNPEAIVFTKAKSTLTEFIQQRRRWASKNFSALNNETKIVSLIIYLFNFSLLVLPIIGLFCFATYSFQADFFKTYFILLGIKCFIDFLLLFLAASFFGKRRLLIYFLPEQFIYIVYIVIVGMLGRKGKYEWKGRKIK